MGLKLRDLFMRSDIHNLLWYANVIGPENVCLLRLLHIIEYTINPIQVVPQGAV